MVNISGKFDKDQKGEVYYLPARSRVAFGLESVAV